MAERLWMRHKPYAIHHLEEKHDDRKNFRSDTVYGLRAGIFAAGYFWALRRMDHEMSDGAKLAPILRR